MTMLQAMQRSLAPQCLPKLRPMRCIDALHKRPSTRFKWVSVEARSFHNSSKDKAVLPPAASSTSTRHQSSSFLTDTTWPEGLLTVFRTCREGRAAPNNRYCGPYNKLLTYCFGANSFEFVVAPEAIAEDELFDCYQDPKNYVAIVVYDRLRRPVMVANVQDDGWATNAALRLEADNRMLDWFDYIPSYTCPLPRFWGLSFLGTSLRAYCDEVNGETTHPKFSRAERAGSCDVLPRDFLKGAWNIDILSQEGFDKMKEVVRDIVESAAALKRKEVKDLGKECKEV